MPLPQIWRRRKAAGRIQPALISLPIPIPESEIPPCFAPVSTPKATMLATARPITSSASIASTSTASGTATPSAPPPLPLARPSRVVSRCAPCSCMPGYGLENIDVDEAEERAHTYTCSLVDAACAYAAATVGSEYVCREERKAAIEARQAAVEDKEAALADRRAALEATLAALQDGEVTLDTLPEAPIVDDIIVYNVAKRSSAYASSIATSESGASSINQSGTSIVTSTSTPTLSHSLITSSSTDSLGPMTPYDIYDDPFASPEGWETTDEPASSTATVEPARDAFADVGRYAEVGRGECISTIARSDSLATPGLGGVANDLRVMEKGGGQAMLEANAHWSQKYRQTVSKPAVDKPPLLVGVALEKSQAGTLFSELSEASKEYGWSLDLDLLTPRAEGGGQRLPIHMFFTNHYWTPDYS
ncbi:hypothetical protein GGG16DRAFT_121280 [Schizophyllum commune]